jgi:hypothetical protein
MITISKTYDLKYQLSFANNYKLSECGKMFNCQRGKEIKKTLCGGSIGYCIKGKFMSITSLQNSLELIPKEEYTPF